MQKLAKTKYFLKKNPNLFQIISAIIDDTNVYLTLLCRTDWLALALGSLTEKG